MISNNVIRLPLSPGQLLSLEMQLCTFNSLRYLIAVCLVFLRLTSKTLQNGLFYPLGMRSYYTPTGTSGFVHFFSFSHLCYHWIGVILILRNTFLWQCSIKFLSFFKGTDRVYFPISPFLYYCCTYYFSFFLN